MTQMEQGQARACPVCGTHDVDDSIEAFEGVCEECGFVIREDIDSVALEWQITNETFEQPADTDWLSECKVRNATEQQLAEAFKEVEEFTDQLGLQNEIREATVDLYCDAFRAGLTDGRETSCVVAACLRLASRKVNTPIPKNRLTEFSDVGKTRLHRSDFVLCDELDVEPYLPTPKEYIPFLQVQLELADEVWKRAERILTTVEGNQSIVGKNPAGVVAGAVYLSQDEYTQSEVAKASGLATETVRQRIKQLREMADDV